MGEADHAVIGQLEDARAKIATLEAELTRHQQALTGARQVISQLQAACKIYKRLLTARR